MGGGLEKGGRADGRKAPRRSEHPLTSSVAGGLLRWGSSRRGRGLGRESEPRETRQIEGERAMAEVECGGVQEAYDNRQVP